MCTKEFNPRDLTDLSSSDVKIKYGCSKSAIAFSKTNPKELYPQFDIFANLLDNEKNVLKWTGIIVLGNLSKVDTDNKIDAILPNLLSFVNDKMLITAANAVNALALIAKYHPNHTDRIIKTILSVEKTNYISKGKVSPECRNVVIGHVLNSFKNFGPEIYSRSDMRSFIQRQTYNTRKKVSDLANKLIKEKY